MRKGPGKQREAAHRQTWESSSKGRFPEEGKLEKAFKSEGLNFTRWMICRKEGRVLKPGGGSVKSLIAYRVLQQSGRR